MNSYHALVVVGGLCSVLAAIPASSQNSISFSTIFAPEPGAPITMTHHLQTSNDMLAELDFANSSGKDVVGVKIAWITLVPDGCSSAAVAPKPGAERTLAIDLKSGATAGLRNVGVSPASLAADPRFRGAALLETQVAVTEVDFADGGMWRSLRNPSEAFAPSETDSLKKNCRDGRLIGPDHAHLTPAPVNASASPKIVGCYWICIGGPSPLECGGGQTCTMNFCKNDHLCPYQQCFMVCP